jgi:AcrR family transcriptional regulator
VPRPKGSRDAGYETKRRELLRKVGVRLMGREAVRPSLRDLAAAADVTVPTLRHYFGGRSDLVEAVFEDLLRQGRDGLRRQEQSEQPFEDSISDYAHDLLRALAQRHEVKLSDVFAVALAEGLVDASVGPATVRHVLEPTLETLEARLRHHIDRGEMIETDIRAAALMLLSPLLLGALHQDQLQGAVLRPMSVEAAADSIVAAFVRAYRAP